MSETNNVEVTKRRNRSPNCRVKNYECRAFSENTAQSSAILVPAPHMKYVTSSTALSPQLWSLGHDPPHGVQQVCGEVQDTVQYYSAIRQFLQREERAGPGLGPARVVASRSTEG